MRLHKHWPIIILLIASFMFYLLRGHVMEDPDFGWHIRSGQVILEKGIGLTDPFSYTMPSFLFIEHEWLTNVVLFKILTWFGFFPLNLLFALLATSTFLLPTMFADKRRILIPLFLALGTVFSFVGVRPQVITWFFVSLLITILFQKSLWIKFRFFLPLLFVLWANLHGGFAIGIIILSIVLVGRSFEQKKDLLVNLVLLLFCLGATFINPYGIRLWGEFWMTLSDTSLRWTIQEWYPAVYFTNISFWIYAVLSIFLLVRYRNKFSRTEIFLFIFFLMSGLSSMRNIPLFVIVSFVMTVRAIGYLLDEAGRFPYGIERFGKAYSGFLIIAMVFFLPQLGVYFYSTYWEGFGKSTYPKEGVSYLRKHLPAGEIFTSYDWGGYLIWQLPEKKVFIDGRMPSWRYDKSIPTESNYAFRDYRKLLTNKIKFEQVVKKYGIDTVLFPRSELEREKVIILGIDVDKYKLLKRFFTRELSFSYLRPQLKNMGWNEVYRDDMVVIFQKPEEGT